MLGSFGSVMVREEEKSMHTRRKKDGSITFCWFVCSKEGMPKPDKLYYKINNPRPDTRTNCQARLGLKNVGGKLN